jgi:hypothetical protein
MKYNNKTSKENYMSYLKDIYNGERNCTALALKNRVSTTTIRALKTEKFVDDNGYSIMTKPPTMQDVNNIMKIRAEIERKTMQLARSNAKRNQLKLAFQPLKSKPTAKIKTQIRTREISILWGLIKIKH